MTAVPRFLDLPPEDRAEAIASIRFRAVQKERHADAHFIAALTAFTGGASAHHLREQLAADRGAVALRAAAAFLEALP